MITWIMILILWGVIGLFGIVIALEDACSMSCFERWSYKQGAAFLFVMGPIGWLTLLGCGVVLMWLRFWKSSE